MSLFSGKSEAPRHGYWPSVADLFMTLFIVMAAIMTAIVAAIIPKKRATGEDTGDLITMKASDLRRVSKVSDDLRETLDILPRHGQKPAEVVRGLEQNAEAVIRHIETLRARLKAMEERAVIQEDKMAKLESDNSRMHQLERELQERKQQLAESLRSLEMIKMENETLAAEKRHTIQELALLSDKPPIIQIDERNRKTRFASGEAAIGDEFRAILHRNHFRQVADEIIRRNRGAKLAVDTLEIIGHTDAAPVNGVGNLDNLLPGYFLRGFSSSMLTNLNAGSNVDLGMMRALAVQIEWQRYIAEIADSMQRERLERIAVRCYSAGQTIPPDRASHRPYLSFDFEFPRDDARRIEIRLTKLEEF